MAQFNSFTSIINTNTSILVAGTAGSGKSNILNILLCAMLQQSPELVRFALLDPKKVELHRYKNVPHCEAYSDTIAGMENILKAALDLIEDRLDRMQAQNVRTFYGTRIYIVIDEMSDLMLTSAKANRLITRIAQLGRAANVLLLTATQHPSREIIPSLIQSNIDLRIGLHTAGKIESRVIGIEGLEKLPRNGEAKILYNGITDHYTIPYITDEQIDKIIKKAIKA